MWYTHTNQTSSSQWQNLQSETQTAFLLAHFDYKALKNKHQIFCQSANITKCQNLIHNTAQKSKQQCISCDKNLISRKTSFQMVSLLEQKADQCRMSRNQRNQKPYYGKNCIQWNSCMVVRDPESRRCNGTVHILTLIANKVRLNIAD